jgi:hypothetical protein
MSINFPTNLDTLSNPTGGDLLENVTTALDHDQQHSNANDAIEALEAKVGKDSSAVTTSHDYKLSGVTGTDKAVSKTGSETLTNKTLTSPAINLSSNATGDIYYRDSGGTFQRLPIGTSTQILSVSTGGIPEWITNSNATAPNYFTAVADENLTIGQPVGISNYVTGLKVARALRKTGTSLTLGFTQNETLDSSSKFCPIGGDKFVYVNSQASDDSLYATVFSVNTSTKTITAGTSSAGTADITAPIYCVSKLDTDKFVVFYVEDASTTIIKYRVGTVSGTTITWGTATTFVTGASAIYTGMPLTSDFISTDKGIMVYKCVTETNGRAVAFTASGTVLTVGTGVAMGTNTDTADTTLVKTIATDKFVIATPAYVQIGTLSGTTITLGTEVAYGGATSTAYDYFDVRSPASNVIAIVYRGVSSLQDMIVATVSGTVPTFGTAVSSGESISGASGGIYCESSTSILTNTYGGGGTSKIMKYTLSGNTLTLVGAVCWGYGATPYKMISMDNGYYVSPDTVGSTSFNYTIQGMSNNFVGIAQGTVSKGASIVVITGGIDSNQSGLIAGGQYLVSSSGLTFSYSLGTMNTVDDKYLLALSATQVLIP